MGDTSVRFEVAPDASWADVVFDAATAAVSIDELIALAHAAGVRVGDEVRARLERAAAAAVNVAAGLRMRVAEAVPPANGQDARIEWRPEFDPACGPARDGADARTDHRRGALYRRVQVGCVLGAFVAATDGVEGIDIRGNSVAARAGAPLGVALDDTLMIAANGDIVANADGVLRCENGRAWISRLLEVPGNVDYGVGNIDFNGDVFVAGAVRPRFCVCATGSVEIVGLVEAAQIRCGGNLVARTGLTQRDWGGVEVGGDVHAVYMERVTGTVRGSLNIARQLVGCTLDVAGVMESSAASVVGGELTARAGGRIGTLGAAAGTRTVVHLPSGIEGRDSERAAQRRLDAAAMLETELVHLRAAGNRLSPAQRERITEIMFELETVRPQAQPGPAVQESKLGPSLIVAGRVYPGVVIRSGAAMRRIDSEIRGPVSFTVEPSGQIAANPGTTSDGQPVRHAA